MERKTTLRNLGEKMQMIKVSVIFVRMIITSPLLAHNLQSQNSVLAAEYMREPLQAQEEAGYVGKMGGERIEYHIQKQSRNSMQAPIVAERKCSPSPPWVGHTLTQSVEKV